MLLNISGEKTKGVKLINTDTNNAKKKVDFTFGATDAALGVKK